MAIYHYSVQIIGRSTGRSAIAAAAYRSGEALVDRQTGEVKDYTRKDRVFSSEILAPKDAPEWATDREELWNSVHEVEKRKDAQLCREINIALPRPRELDIPSVNLRRVARRFVQDNYVAQGMVADVAYHDMEGNNPHMHVMLTTREITPAGFGKKKREWNDRKFLQQQREAWADHLNKVLEIHGQDRIDHRSLEAQGEERQAQIHLGPKPAPERVERNEEIQRANMELKALTDELRAVQGQIKHENDPEILRRRDEKKLLAKFGFRNSDEARRQLNELKEKWKGADIQYFHIQRDIEKHNKHCDNIGFFKKNFNLFEQNRINKRAKELEEKQDSVRKDLKILDEKIKECEKAFEILYEKEKPERERKAKERAIEFELQKVARKEKEMQRQQNKKIARGRGRDDDGLGM